MYVSMYDLYARMHTTARACRILLHAHLATPLACKIRLALLVVNSVKLHLTAYKLMWPLAKKVLELLSVYKPFVSCLNGFVTCFWKHQLIQMTCLPVCWKHQPVWMACSPPFLGNFILLQQLGHLFVGNLSPFEQLDHLFVVNFRCWNGLVISPGQEQRQPFKFQCFQDLLYCKSLSLFNVY